MNKQQVLINVDWADKNFCAAPADETIACVATGRDIEEVEKNIVEALKFHIEGMREYQEVIPAELEGEWEPVFKLTARAQIRYSDNYITRKALARETGIAEQQLSHYANGQRKPKPATQRKIVDGILAISKRLAFVSE